MPRTTPRLVLTAAVTVAVLAAAPSAQAAPKPGVIVKPKPGVTSSALDGLLGASPVVGQVFGTTARVVRPVGSSAALIRTLNRSGLVAYAEEDKVLTAQAVPNDPQFGALYGLAKIQAPAAWDALGLGAFPATGGPKVGIVDTGIRTTHEDLAGKVVDCANVSQGLLGLFGGGKLTEGSCADGNGHGTHVAGTIAASANNGKGVTGVAFNAQLSICKALSDAGSGSTSAIASCINYLAGKGVKVISMSLGGGGTTTLQQAVQNAWKGGAGALVVAAAGNDGNATLNYPAAYPEVVSVAATDQADAKASFSNANADVEVAAPGVDITSTWGTGDTAYNTISGTSMATPHAAGVAALIATRFPGATGQDLRTRLDAATDDLGPAGRDQSFGFGRVDALKAATQ